MATQHDFQFHEHHDFLMATRHYFLTATQHDFLYYDHHDFLLATRYPSAIPALRGLAAKYLMPVRMWKHGIHAFLELLRHRQPDPQDYMPVFIYTGYQTTLLLETAPGFMHTWIVCLEDLAWYRMAVENDMRTTWTVISAFWYASLFDRHPTFGRLYRHFGILEKTSLRKFYLYSLALMSVVPFSDGTRSLRTLYSLGMCFTHNKPPLADTTSSRDTPLIDDTTLPKLLATTPGGPDDRSEDQLKRKKDPDGWELLEDLEQVARLLLSRESPERHFDIEDDLRRLIQFFLDRLAGLQQRLLVLLRQNISVLRLSAALYVAGTIPCAYAAPILSGPASGMEAGLQTFWQITLTLAPLAIAVGGICRIAWIMARHERPLNHPIWSGALSLIVGTVWGVVRTAESAFTKEQACMLTVHAAIWAELVADSSRMVNNRVRYFLGVVLGGGLLTLALLALDFVFGPGSGQANSRSEYMTQAVNKGPFLLTITTLGIYICQKYCESIPTKSSAGTTGSHHDAHELAALRID